MRRLAGVAGDKRGEVSEPRGRVGRRVLQLVAADAIQGRARSRCGESAWVSGRRRVIVKAGRGRL